MMPWKQKKSRSPSTNTDAQYLTIIPIQLPPMPTAMVEDGSPPELPAANVAPKLLANVINWASSIECLGIEWFWWMSWVDRAFWPSLVLLVLKPLWRSMLCRGMMFGWILFLCISLTSHEQLYLYVLDRFIIFEKEGDAKENGKSEEKFKDDRRQLRSVTTALHLPTSLKLDKFLSHFVMDIHKVGRDNDPTLCHDELSDSNQSVSEDSDDENLTEAY